MRTETSETGSDLQAFLAEHKDIMPICLPSLLGTYSTCRATELRGEFIDPVAAYNHVLGGKCDWCSETYRSQARALTGK